MTSEQKIVFRAEQEFLSSKPGYTIIETNIKDFDSKVVDLMVKFCQKSVSGSWSIASLKKYEYYITLRMWDTKGADRFRRRFNKWLKYPERTGE